MSDDTQLINGIKQKDPEIFRIFVEAWQDQVINICFGFTRNKEDARELAQDVFIEVYNSINKFRGECSLSTWLYRIAVNKSLNHIRKAKRRRWLGFEDLFADNPEDIVGNQEDYIADKNVQDDLENIERIKILNMAVSSLPHNQKVAFTLSKFNDMPYQNIAEVMKISLPAVESLIFRAKKNLQKKLIRYYENKF